MFSSAALSGSCSSWGHEKASLKSLRSTNSDWSEGSTVSTTTCGTKPSKGSLSSKASFASKATRASTGTFLSKASRSASSIFPKGFKFGARARASSTASNASASTAGTWQSQTELEVGDLCEAVSALCIRDAESLESDYIGDFPAGTSLVVLQVGEGRRLKVRAAAAGSDASAGPSEGWVSSRTTIDEALLVRCAPDVPFAAADLDIGGRHEVKFAATMRSEEGLNSEVVGDLAAGAIVRIVQLGRVNRRRVLVAVDSGEGAQGWISAVTRQGDVLLGNITEARKLRASSSSSTVASSTVSPTKSAVVGHSVGDAGKNKALLDAVMSGDCSAVRALLARPASLSSGSMFSKFAPSSRSAVADVSTRDLRGKTPLIYAAAFGHKDVVELLLGHGADVHAVDDTLKSALHHAARRGSALRSSGGEAAAAAVAAAGTAPGAAPTAGAPGGGGGEAAERYLATAAIVQLLLHHGAGLDTCDHNGWTPLIIAVANGHTCVVKELLEASASVSIRDKEGNCAMDYAMHFGHSCIATLLSERGAAPAVEVDDEVDVEADVEAVFDDAALIDPSIAEEEAASPGAGSSGDVDDEGEFFVDDDGILCKYAAAPPPAPSQEQDQQANEGPSPEPSSGADAAAVASAASASAAASETASGAPSLGPPLRSPTASDPSLCVSEEASREDDSSFLSVAVLPVGGSTDSLATISGLNGDGADAGAAGAAGDRAASGAICLGRSKRSNSLGDCAVFENSTALGALKKKSALKTGSKNTGRRKTAKSIRLAASSTSSASVGAGVGAGAGGALVSAATEPGSEVSSAAGPEEPVAECNSSGSVSKTSSAEAPMACVAAASAAQRSSIATRPAAVTKKGSVKEAHFRLITSAGHVLELCTGDDSEVTAWAPKEASINEEPEGLGSGMTSPAGTTSLERRQVRASLASLPPTLPGPPLAPGGKASSSSQSAAVTASSSRASVASLGRASKLRQTSSVGTKGVARRVSTMSSSTAVGSSAAAPSTGAKVGRRHSNCSTSSSIAPSAAAGAKAVGMKQTSLRKASTRASGAAGASRSGRRSLEPMLVRATIAEGEEEQRQQREREKVAAAPVTGSRASLPGPPSTSTTTAPAPAPAAEAAVPAPVFEF